MCNSVSKQLDLIRTTLRHTLSLVEVTQVGFMFSSGSL